MSDASDRLRARREALLRQAGRQREELGRHLGLISGALDRADRGLGLARRIATPPVLIAAGVAVTFVLGRGRTRRLLAAGITLLGIALRARTAGQILAGLAGSQVVRRSR